MPNINALYTKAYDVIIVGAGPAGCAAAVYLSRLGLKTLMLDKDRFPRDKICGDGISALSVYLLKRMDFFETAMGKDPWLLEKIEITSPDNTVLNADIPTHEPYGSPGFVFPRKEFDHLLLNHVRALENVEVVEGFKVTDLVFENGRCLGVRGVHGGAEQSISGKCVIGADGFNSVIAKKISCYNDKPSHRAFAMRAYFTGVENLIHGIELYYDSRVLPAYGWIFPVNETTANVGVGLYTRFSSAKDIKNIFEIFVDNNVRAKTKLKNARIVNDTLKGCPLTCGSFPYERSRGNVLLSGDAGSFIDTLTGEGISNALMSGEFAATAISEALRQNKPLDAGKIYARLWKRHFYWGDFKVGYFLQPFMSNKVLINFFIRKAVRDRRLAERMSGAICHVLPKRKIIF